MSEFAKLEETRGEGSTRSGVYCALCSKSMSEETWEIHSKSPAHSSNAEHFDLLFEPRRQGAGLICNFCGESVSWDVMKQHEKQHFLIPWDKSEDKYDRYKIFFENHIVEWKNSYACYACGLTFGEWSTALVHIVDSEHQARLADGESLEDATPRGAPSYEFLVKEGLIAAHSPSSLECTICEGCGVSLENALRHVKGLAHLSNASRFAFASQRNDEENEEASLCDYVARKSYRTYRCVICECEFDAELKAEHISSAMHSASLELHRCHAVALLSGKDYYCRACDCFVTSLADVYEHVKEKKHCAVEDDEDNGEFNWLVTDENATRCVVCECVVTSRNHAMEKYHENSLKIHGCDRIEAESYSCRACALAFARIEDIHRHVTAPEHLNSLSEKTTDTRDFSHCYIVAIDENDCRCVLCGVDLAASEISVERHVAGTAHARNIDKHGCRSVSKIGNDVYYCGACRCAIRGRWEVYSHVKEETHSSLAGCAAEEDMPKNAAMATSGRLPRVKNEEIVRSEEEIAINAAKRLPCVGADEDILRQAQREAQPRESKEEMSTNAAKVASRRSRTVGTNGNILPLAQREAQQIASKEEIAKNTALTASKRLHRVGTNEIFRSEAQSEAQHEAQREAQQLDSTKEILMNAVPTLSAKSAPIGWKKQVLKSLAQQEAHRLDSRKELDEEMSSSDAKIVPLRSLRARTNEKILQSIAQRRAQHVDSKRLFAEEMTKSASETIPTKSRDGETGEKVLQSKAQRGAQHHDSKLEVSINDVQTILTESAPIGTKQHSLQSAQQRAQHDSKKKLKNAAEEDVAVKLSSTQRAAQQLDAKKEKEEMPKNAAQKISKRSPSVAAKEILQIEAQRAAQQLEKNQKEEMPKNAAQKIPKKSPSVAAKEILQLEAQRAAQQLEEEEMPKNVAQKIPKRSPSVAAKEILQLEAQRAAQQLEEEEMPKNVAQKIPKRSPSVAAKEILQMEAQRAAQQLEEEEMPKNAAQKIHKKSPSVAAKEILQMEAQRAAQQLEEEEMPKNAAQIIPKKLPTAEKESEDTDRSKAQRAAQQLDANKQSKEETPKNVAQKIPMEWAQRLEKKESEETFNGEEDNFTRDYVVKVWDKMYFCLLCECPVHPTPGNYESHVNGRVHREATSKYGCDGIKFANDAYRCDRCDLQMHDFQDVWLHLKDTSHLDRVEAKEEIVHSQTSQNTEAILYYVNVYEDKRAYCEICECELSLSHRNITSHVTGKAHANSRREFGCENIVKLTELTYKCKCCDHAINNMADVYTHVKSTNHLTLARNKNLVINPKVVETKKSFLTSNGESEAKMAASAKTKNDSNDRTERCDTSDIVVIEENKYFCHRCDCTIHGEANFYGHARGKRHFAASLKRSANDS